MKRNSIFDDVQRAKDFGAVFTSEEDEERFIRLTNRETVWAIMAFTLLFICVAIIFFYLGYQYAIEMTTNNLLKEKMATFLSSLA